MKRRANVLSTLILVAVIVSLVPSIVTASTKVAFTSRATGTGSGFTGPSGVAGLPTPVTDISEFESIACIIIDWIFWGLIVFSIIMALVAGYKYATSGGDPERVSDANRTLIYVAIAIVVALIAGGLPLIIGDFFDVTSGLGTCG